MDAHFVELQTALAGRYSLERELGRGGMGVVYLAHEVALDRPVALKVLPPALTGSDGVRDRFLREARTAARLSHPHIVPIFTVDQVGDFVFFAMAAIDGETLGERVRSKGPLSSADATRLVKEVSWALAYAHAQGVVHRDIKPDNILVERGTGRALITDFGIAEVGAEDDAEGAAQVFGTAEFMSPEQAKGAPVDARSDLYSLAAVGFYAVSGRAPFEGPNPAAILGRHLSEPAPRLASVVPGVSLSLAGVIDRCLRKDPEQRLLGGESVADALAQEAMVERQLPVPLRVFIKKLRELSRSAVSLIIVSLFFVLPMALMLMVEGGPLAALVGAVTYAGSWSMVFLAAAVWQARKVTKAGFTVEETRLALLEDVNRRNEELRFEVGPRSTKLDAVLDRFVLGTLGIAGIAAAALWGLGMGGDAVSGLFSFSLTAGLLGGSYWTFRRHRRADLWGERWLRLWGGSLGDGLFELAGLGVDAPASLPSGVHRSTEVALGLAAVRLFDELPRESKRELSGLPDTVRRLEADARALRAQIKELKAVLEELGDESRAQGSATHAAVRRDVEATRDEAERRQREVVAALETIRVGLLRMHAGESVVHSVTMELDAAREISGDLQSLLAGHREVERLLAERRATG